MTLTDRLPFLSPQTKETAKWHLEILVRKHQLARQGSNLRQLD